MKWAILAVLFEVACSTPGRAAPELIGKWSAGQTDPDGVHGTSATWDFRPDGTFEMSGYPPILVKGRWQVTERAPGRLRLQLTEQEMSAPGMDSSRWDDQNDWGDLTDGGRTFRFAGKTLRRAAQQP
ncbi:MAG TPA: hypothetical protein VKB80_08795 [Kofleriaceae bacterium]|nr:hypothetical protein [Kofleriaceae bacterium]